VRRVILRDGGRVVGCRRVGLGQERHGSFHPRLIDAPGRIVAARSSSAGRELVGPRSRRAADVARPARRHGVPGPDEHAQSGAHDRDQMRPGARSQERMSNETARASIDRGAHCRAHSRRRGSASTPTRSILGGMRQRVAIAIALLHRRRLIICDERRRAGRIDPGPDPDRDAQPGARPRDGADLDQP